MSASWQLSDELFLVGDVWFQWRVDPQPHAGDLTNGFTEETWSTALPKRLRLRLFGGDLDHGFTYETWSTASSRLLLNGSTERVWIRGSTLET
jgi:hypothetical protein